MMSGGYSLIDLPLFVPVEQYEVSISFVTSALMNHGKVKSVYHIGGVTSPGISDLDLVVVFRDHAMTAYNPLKKADEKTKYLFVHKLFGSSESHFNACMQLTNYHNYRLTGGDESRPVFNSSPGSEEIIKRQTAKEFLLKMFLVMNMQKAYRIIKVRTFLLEARALEYDLQFLGITGGPLLETIMEIISLRKKWFLNNLSASGLPFIFEKLLTDLGNFLSSTLPNDPLFTPSITEGRISTNARWENGNNVFVKKSGFSLPAFPAGIFARKYFNLQNRLVNFAMTFPVNPSYPVVLQQRAELIRAMNVYNKKHIPEFIPLASGLRLS